MMKTYLGENPDSAEAIVLMSCRRWRTRPLQGSKRNGKDH